MFEALIEIIIQAFLFVRLFPSASMEAATNKNERFI